MVVLYRDKITMWLTWIVNDHNQSNNTLQSAWACIARTADGKLNAATLTGRSSAKRTLFKVCSLEGGSYKKLIELLHHTFIGPLHFSISSHYIVLCKLPFTIPHTCIIILVMHKMQQSSLSRGYPLATVGRRTKHVTETLCHIIWFLTIIKSLSTPI